MTLSLHDYLSERGLDKWVAELGCTDALVPRQGIRTSLAFFVEHMPRLQVRDAVGFLAAMDLSKPVHDVPLAPGVRLIGFRTETESPFKLFFARRGASAHALGVNTARRGPVHFVVRTTVWALESWTSPTIDSHTPRGAGQGMTVAPRAKKWFGREFGVMVPAGGQQLVVPESYSHLLVESR
jgi:hypothetical protein